MNSIKGLIYCITFVHLFILQLSQSCMTSTEMPNPQPPKEMKCKGTIPCIPLHQCESANELLRLRNYVDRIKVQESRCGFKEEMMKVCCAEKAVVEGLEDEDIFPKECGLISSSTRIFGGTETEMGEFPWLVGMFYKHRKRPNYYNLHCAGSLINPRYVMTAAHCLHRDSLKNLVLHDIRIGDHNITSSTDCMRKRNGTMDCSMTYITAHAENEIIHPRYELQNSLNDIALIRLDITVDMDETLGNIAPACLPSAGINPEYLASMSKRYATVVGWGHTPNGSSDVPLKVSIPFYTDKQSCADKLQKPPLIKEQICLGGEEGKDSCRGDSGGPLMLVGDRLAPYLQIGIVSYGPLDCGSKHLPGVYTSVSHYIDWIRSCMKIW